jgi:hypothetical protein
METINRRNTDTFEQANKDMSTKMFKQQEQIDGLTRTVSMLVQKTADLEQQLTLYKGLKMTGLGPSVKT